MEDFFEQIHEATKGYALVECFIDMNTRFMSMRKIEMTELADRLSLDYKKSMRKAEIDEKLEAHFTKEQVRKDMSELSDHAYDVLMKLYKSQFAKFDLLESHCLTFLADLGYISYVKSWGCYFTDKEILDLIKEVISEEDFASYRHKKAFLKTTMIYVDTLYMAIDEPILFGFMNEREKDHQKMSYEEIRHLCDELQPIMYYNGKGKYISTLGMMTGQLEMALNTRLVTKMTYPSLEDLEDYMNYDLPIHKECYQNLLSYLLFDTAEVPIYAYDKCRLVFYMSMLDENPQTIVEKVIEGLSTKYTRDLTELIFDCYDETPHRSLGGATAMEFKNEYLENEGGYHLPKTEEMRKIIDDVRDRFEEAGLEIFEEKDSFFVKFPDEPDDYAPDDKETNLIN